MESFLSMARAKDPRYFILGTIPTKDDKTITGSKLPTRKQVQLAFIAHKEEIAKENYNKKVCREAANRTAQSILSFYERARIPALAPNKVAEEIMAYYIKFKDLLKIPISERGKPGTPLERIQEFKIKMPETMKILAQRCNG